MHSSLFPNTSNCSTSYLNSPLGLHVYTNFNINCTSCYNANSGYNNFLTQFNNFKAKFNTNIYCPSSDQEPSTNNNCLKIYYQNVRGLRTKIFNFISNLILLQYDIFVLTETWLSQDISSAEYFSSEYLVFRVDRNKNNSTKVRGGGGTYSY